MRGEIKEKAKDKNNGHIYMKVLRESIMNELSLAKPTEAIDLAYKAKQKRIDEVNNHFEFEGTYNDRRVNNTNELGFDNYEQRLQKTKESHPLGDLLKSEEEKEKDEERREQTRDLAHDTIFDKLLADYFLNKRGQFKKSNELLNSLSDHYNQTGFPEGHPDKINDPDQKDINSSPFNMEANSSSKPALAFQLLKQRIGKVDKPHIDPTDFVAMMELDIALQRSL